MFASAQHRRPLHVGLLLPSWTIGKQAEHSRSWNDLLALAQEAEAIGVDSLWVPDLAFSRFDAGCIGAWECWSLLAALAASTTTVTLGSLVTCTNYRHPAFLASFATTLDEISGGRFVIGLGIGESSSGYAQLGLPWEQRCSRFEEALVIIHRLLRTGRVDFQGTHYQVREWELRPTSTRKNGPAILIGTSVPAGRRMLRLTAQYADIWNGGAAIDQAHLDQLPDVQRALDDACQNVARAPETLQRTVEISMALEGYPCSYGPTESLSDVWTGSPDVLAERLRALVKLGITQVQLLYAPYTSTGLHALGEVLRLLESDD